MDLFIDESQGARARSPLADRMRPRQLDEICGQRHLLARGTALRAALEAGHPPSMILWGPPGSGKTTIAMALARHTKSRVVSFSAVTGGLADVRKVVAGAEALKSRGETTVLFVDEIHRFNKAQQDAFLPHVEKGTITLIGATTENPSFEVNAALLSRLRVFVLEPLSDRDLEMLLDRACSDVERGLGQRPPRFEENVRGLLVRSAHGDARKMLTTLELAHETALRDDESPLISLRHLKDVLGGRVHLYDKSGEEHYNLISALHKSLRGSDADASLYWLYRMLASGEDPMYLLRRLIRFASEDVGLADPQALVLAVAARDAYHMLGSPEGELALAQLTVYLAKAPKDVSVYQASRHVRETIAEAPDLPVPLHLRNAPTELMHELGYGKGYRYPPDHADRAAHQTYLPDALAGRRWLTPLEPQASPDGVTIKDSKGSGDPHTDSRS